MVSRLVRAASPLGRGDWRQVAWKPPRPRLLPKASGGEFSYNLFKIAIAEDQTLKQYDFFHSKKVVTWFFN